MITKLKVTGTFADTINWAKASNEQLAASLGNGSAAQKAFNKAIEEGLPVEDAFSEALAATSNEQERAKIVADFLNNTYGQSKKTYDEMTVGIQNAATAELELKETQSELAESIEPVNTAFTELKNKALQTIQPIVESLAEKFLEFMGFLEEHPTVTKLVTAGVLALTTALSVLAGALAIQGLINGVQKAMSLLNITLLANPIVLIVAAIAGLVAGFIYLWTTSEKFRNFWIGLWEKIKEATSVAIEFVINLFNNIIDFAKNNWQGLLLLLLNPFAGAFKLLYENCEGFRNFIDNFIQSIKDFFINGWNAIVTFFTEGIPNFFAMLKEWFDSLPEKLGYLIGLLIGHVILFFQRLWTFATVDIPLFIETVITWFSTLPGRIWNWLIIAWNNIITWGSNIITTGTEKAQGFLSSVVSFFKSLPDSIWTWLTSTVDKVIDWGANMLKEGSKAATDFFDDIVETVEELPEKMLQAGKDMLTGFKDGIEEKYEEIKGKITGFFSGITDGVRDVLEINSPSRVFRKIGNQSAEGYEVGWENEIDKVKRSVVDSMDLGSDLNINLNKPSNKNINSNNNPSTGKTVIVNQTINSRKEPSRSEMYRYTKNIATLVAQGG